MNAAAVVVTGAAAVGGVWPPEAQPDTNRVGGIRRVVTE